MHLANVYDDLITNDKLKEIQDYVSQFKYDRFETDNEEYDFKTNTYDFKHDDPFLMEVQKLFWDKRVNINITKTNTKCVILLKLNLENYFCIMYVEYIFFPSKIIIVN